MKKLKKLSLMNFSQTEMEKRKLNIIKGGRGCPMDCDYGHTCGCLYAGPQGGPNDSYYGGSSTEANDAANYDDSVFDWFSDSAN